MTNLHHEDQEILILNRTEYNFLMRNIEHLLLDTQKILSEATSNSDEYFEVSSTLELLDRMEDAVFELKDSDYISIEEEKICDSILESFCSIFGPIDEDDEELNNDYKGQGDSSNVLKKSNIDA